MEELLQTFLLTILGTGWVLGIFGFIGAMVEHKRLDRLEATLRERSSAPSPHDPT